MRVELIDDISIENLDAIVLLDRIDFNDKRVFRLIQSFKGETDSLVRLLNGINNQGISNIQTEKMMYTRNNRDIEMFDMCSAEKLFMLCFIANVSAAEVWILDSVINLDSETKQLFYSNFKNSVYINILTDLTLTKKMIERCLI